MTGDRSGLRSRGPCPVQEARRFSFGPDFAARHAAIWELRTDVKPAEMFIAGVLSASMPGLLQGAAPGRDPGVELARTCSGERVTFPLPPLELFDEDADRQISKDEAASCSTLAQMFSRLDLDASGTLTATEYDGFPELWRRRAVTLRDEPPDDDG